jgi:hypothetical protein
MESNNPTYPVTIEGNKLTLRFDFSDAPTKQGIKLQFVLPKELEDQKDQIKDKIFLAIQKRFTQSGVPIDYDDRNPYKNVIAFIIPLTSVSNLLFNMLKGK